MNLRRKFLVTFATAAALGAGVPAIASAETGPMIAVPSTGQPAQITSPAGKSRGVAIVIHGGAWQMVGPDAMASQRDNIDVVVGAGWTAVNIDYRPGYQSVADSIAAYDWIRETVGPKTPICTVGDSAGGHLALMIAWKRPDVACVVAMGAPTDLPAVQGTQPFLWEAGVVASFPLDQLDALSPALHAKEIKAKILAGAVATDPVVPPAQTRELVANANDAKGMFLKPGDAPFVHVNADVNDRARFRDMETDLLIQAENRVLPAAVKKQQSSAKARSHTPAKKKPKKTSKKDKR